MHSSCPLGNCCGGLLQLFLLPGETRKYVNWKSRKDV